MLQTLLQWDQELFLWINGSALSPFAEAFFPLITDLHKTMVFKVAVLPLILALIFYRLRKKGFVYLFMLLLAVGTSDFIGGKIIKPAVGRDRPTEAGIQVELRHYHYGGKSFPSNHALNIFTICVFSAFVFPGIAIPLVIFAALVAYSRVYVGVHYPLDIFVGALLGIVIGFLYSRLWKMYMRGGLKWRKS